MSENKRYYWLKLDEGFFEDDTIEWLEEQENGKDYVIFYLKLCLKSLKNEGHLIRLVGERLIPYDIKALAKLTNTSPDTVAVAMKVFLEIGLVETLETGEIYLKQIDEMIGSETDVAKRVRKHRAKKNMLQGNKKQLQSNIKETKCNTEIEKEIEIDIELEKETEQEGSSTLTKKEIDLIIEKWNELNLQQLRSINSNTKRHTMLKARIKEYSLDEILQAIDSIKDSPFLQGQNKRGWTIVFDWFVKPNNFIKVLEGNYLDNSNDNSPNPPNSSNPFLDMMRDEMEAAYE